MKHLSQDWESLQDGIIYGNGFIKYCNAYLPATNNSIISFACIHMPNAEIFEDAILLRHGVNFISIKKSGFKAWKNFQTDKEDLFEIHTENVNYLISKTHDN